MEKEFAQREKRKNALSAEYLNMKDIQELYQEGVSFHGHSCPGLALGVRASYIAIQELDVEDIHAKGLYCISEKQACYMDGIQVVMGCTTGNKNLIYYPTGKSVFSFYNRNNGKSIRLYAKDMPSGMERDEKIQYVLTAPVEEIFVCGPATLPFPPKIPKAPSAACSQCGEMTDESFLRLRDGKLLCPECYAAKEENP